MILLKQWVSMMLGCRRLLRYHNKLSQTTPGINLQWSQPLSSVTPVPTFRFSTINDQNEYRYGLRTTDLMNTYFKRGFSYVVTPSHSIMLTSSSSRRREKKKPSSDLGTWTRRDFTSGFCRSEKFRFFAEERNIIQEEESQVRSV